MKPKAINQFRILKQLLVILFITLYSSTCLYAQSNSINYKAIIKDGSGNVVANQMVGVQFIILSNTVNVYQEIHPATTDANGLVILNIGTGNTSDVYSDIDWETYDHTLNVQVDTGSGLVDLGTTTFNMVPYANAAGNVSGLEALDEGNGIGWRIKERDPANYGNIGEKAVDLSYNSVASTTKGATGLISTAFGGYNTASGIYSTAMGNNTLAFGYYSTSLGASTKAEAYGSTAIGRYNIGGGTKGNIIVTDPLFEVGNGVDNATRSNALTILHNGKVGIGEHQPTGYLEVKAFNSNAQPNVNLIHKGATGARINFTNTDTTNGNVWTLYGDTNDIDANSIFNIYHPNAGNIVKVRGNAKVEVIGDLSVSGTTKIGSSGAAISEIIKLTGVTGGVGGGSTGSNSIPYPPGYDWENTYVVSFKVRSTVGAQGGVSWYTSLGNYSSGDSQSVYVNLGGGGNGTNDNITLKISDSQYIGAAYVLILMKID